MPLSHTTRLFAVTDAKISKMLTDPPAGTPTYGPSVDVPGIKSIPVDFDFVTADLTGDNRRLDQESVVMGAKIGINFAKLQLDLLAMMLGGTVTDSGVTPAQVATYSRLGTGTLGYWKIEATPSGGDVGIGDVHLVFHKCKLLDWKLGLVEGNYQMMNGQASAFYTTSTDKLFDIIENETPVAIVTP